MFPRTDCSGKFYFLFLLEVAKAQKSVNEEGFTDIYNSWKGEIYGWAFSEWEKNFKDLKNDGFLEIGKETIIY